MEKYSKPVKDRFRLALIPSILLGIVTNVYISGIILFADYPILLISPLIGTVIFTFLYYRLKRFKIRTQAAFLIGSYAVAAEVIVHTWFFGWNAGFYFFLFLLPLVFLLESNWKLWSTIFFNATIFAVIIGLYYVMKNSSHSYLLSSIEMEVMAFLNGTLTGVIVVAIIIYSSRTLHKRDLLLLDIISDLETSNQQIAKQNGNQKILLKEIHHRVKNNLQIISSLLSLQSRNLEGERAEDVLNESRARVEAIALIHMKLYQDELGNAVDFKSYLEDFIVKQCMLNSHIKFNLNAQDLVLHLDIAVPLGLIVSELITNSVKHAFKEIETPELTIELISFGGTNELWVKDNGIGIPEKFNFNSGDLGLGADIIVALTDQIDASISYYNIDGANFKISFQNKALE